MKIKSVCCITSIIFGITTLFTPTANSQVVLYGLTWEGGTHLAGTLFSITPSGNMQIVANLDSSTAAAPFGSLVYASDGNFYASSYYGGYEAGGSVFRCTPGGIQTNMINIDTVWGFSETTNSIIQAMDGNLYGMVTMGGPSDDGLIFKLQLSGEYTAIHYFSGSDGIRPFGSLIQTADSNLWGMTLVGGNTFTGSTFGGGTIFKLKPSGIFTLVYNFNDSLNGFNPYGDLLSANDGNFYGLLNSGGKYNLGALFRFSPSGTFTKLVDFNDTNGASPYGSLIQASDGNLYGMTSGGGDSVFGTLFVCTLSGNLTTLVSFNDSNGANPWGTLMQASDSNIYGMTEFGGRYNLGTIFQLSLSHTFTKIFDLNGTVGFNPVFGKLIEITDTSTGINKITNNPHFRLFPNPNNGHFTIQSSAISGNSLVEIYNTFGQQIYSQFNIQHSTFSIDLSSQPNGVYLYRVINENGNDISNGKFVIGK